MTRGAMLPETPMKPQILVVEDEPTILDNILYSLETEGFDPIGCPTGGEALETLNDSPDVQLVILDIGLPDTTGLDLCKQIRAERPVPVIFLTARDSELDRVLGLEIGADDYVVKPFSPRELCARVKAVLRRSGGAPTTDESSDKASPAPVAVDEVRMKIHYFGEALTLSSTEFKLLAALAKQPGRVYSRSQLMDAAWEEPEAAMERTVDAHIKSLRAKMNAVRDGIEPVQTHRGLGYSLREDWS
jgi:two-component system catabolic regulation response regulator CreB